MAFLSFLLTVMLFHQAIFTFAMPSNRVHGDIPAKDEPICIIEIDEITEIKFIVAHESCYKEMGMVYTFRLPTSALLGKPKLEELIQFDDKCFAKCIYKQLGLYNDVDGMKTGLETVLKSNMTAWMMEKTNKFWGECIVDAEDVVRATGLTFEGPCKTAMLHRLCFERKMMEFFGPGVPARHCKNEPFKWP